MDQQFQQLRNTLPRLLIAVVAPAAGERLTGLPWNFLPSDARRGLHLELFRGHKIPSVIRIHQIQTIVNDNAGLESANVFHKVDRIPILVSLAELMLDRVVEPDDVNLAVSGQELVNLAPHVLAIAIPVPALVQPREGLLRPVPPVLWTQRMSRVNQVVGMVPVLD